MTRTITIINPCGSSSLKKPGGKKSIKKRKNTMATKRKRRKKSTVKRKRTRTKARRRKNPKAKPHRITVYKTRKRGKVSLRRGKRYRLKPRRVNPNFKMVGKYFGKNRMINAVSLLAGMGASALAKSFAVRTVINPYFDRFYGLISIVLGATLNMKGKKLPVKSAGTGFVVFGLYDLLVQNVPALQAYLPSISGPSFMTAQAAESVQGNYFGRTVGSSISAGPIETVGANIYGGMSPEIISGDDMDIADALEMSLD